jgi:hypothetical protein
VDAVPVPASEPASAPSLGKPLDDDPHATIATRRPGTPTMERARMGASRSMCHARPPPPGFPCEGGRSAVNEQATVSTRN